MKTLSFIILLSIVFYCCQKNPSANNGITAVPTLTTTVVTSITSTTAASGGNISADGGATVTARGICWSTSTNPDITGNHTTNGTGIGIFTSNITGLTASTTYYVRAYATNSAGTAYGNEISFTATTTATALPTVTTTSVSAITTTTALTGGNVSADGGASVTVRGVCWSTSPNPIVTSNHTSDGTGTGVFTSSITGLIPNTIYYARAYATNSVGTSYGNQINFTSSTTATLPAIVSLPITAITATGASSGGNITSDGGAAVTARGVCWGTAANPVVTGSHTTDGTGIGVYTSLINGLTQNTVYYARAYATNNVGTVYGNEISFTSGSASASGVYVGGYQTSVVYKRPTIWKDGVPTVLYGFYYTTLINGKVNDVYVSGNDVYAVGYDSSNLTGLKNAYLWKNGTPTILGDQSKDEVATGIFVSGTDVYVSGNEGDHSGNQQSKAVLWKNGVQSTISQGPGGAGAFANAVFVSGSDVYVGGNENNGTGAYIVPKIWKNGIAMSLPVGPYSNSINALFVSGTDVYASGEGFDPFNYYIRSWKNGVSTNVGNSVVFDYNSGVYFSGGDLYIAGDSYSGSRSIATVWKNGVRTQLNTGTENYYAKDVFVFGSDVYVVGQKDGAPHPIAKLWKNGIETSLTDGTNDAEATCIFVK